MKPGDDRPGTSASSSRSDAPEPRAQEIAIGGLQAWSSVDFPGGLCAVVFCQGCPWRCGYCHNPHLIPSARPTSALETRADRPDRAPSPDWTDVLALLERRRGLLDAVVLSGGEPTAQPGLREAVRAIRSLGYRVGLHTNGAFPDRLGALLPDLDWVGMDAKAPFEDYDRLTGIAGSGERARVSASLLIASGVAHEFRTTWHPDFVAPADLIALARTLHGLGAHSFAVQEFRPGGCADTACDALARSPVDEALRAELDAAFPGFVLRRA